MKLTDKFKHINWCLRNMNFLCLFGFHDFHGVRTLLYCERCPIDSDDGIWYLTVNEK